MRIIGIILAAIVVIVTGFLWYAGAFASAKVEEKQFGGQVIAGLEHRGSYKNVPKTIDEVDAILSGMNLDPERGFGIYRDNPDEVAEEDLRSFVGAVIEGDNLKRLEDIRATNLTIDTLPHTTSLIVDLPVRTQMAYMFGPFKAYPALTEAAEEKGYTPLMVYEYYDLPARRTLYVMPVEK